MALPWLLIRLGSAPSGVQGGYRSMLAFWAGGANDPGGTPPTPSARPPQAGGAFTKRPDRLHGRRLTLRDLQEHFSAEQDALERAARAKRERERKALQDAAQAVSSVLRAAVGADEGIEPDLADVARKLTAAAAAKRINHAVRLAQEATARARAIEAAIELERDDEDAAFLLL